MRFSNWPFLIFCLEVITSFESESHHSFQHVLTRMAFQEEQKFNGSSKDLLPILATSRENSVPKICNGLNPKLLEKNNTFGRYDPDYCLSPGIKPIMHLLLDFALYHQVGNMLIVVDEANDWATELRFDIYQATKLLSSNNVKVQLSLWKNLDFLQVKGAFLIASVTEVAKENLFKLNQFMKKSSADTVWLMNSQNPKHDFKDIYAAFDSNFFTYTFQDDVGTVHEAYRIKAMMPLIINVIGVWNPNFGLIMTMLQKWTRRSDLGGIQITAAVAADPPYIDFSYTNGKDGPLKVWGFGYDVWHSFELSMNFSTLFVPSIDGKWGAKDENGSFDGIIGMLQRQEVEAGVSSFSLIQSRAEVADFIGPFISLQDGLYYRDIQIFDNNTFIAPLSGYSWLAFACSILLCAGAYFTVTRIGDPSDRRHRHDYLLSLMIMMHGVSGQGAPVEPTKIPGRVIFIMVYLTGFVTIAVYSAALTSILAVKIHRHPFSDETTMYYNSPYNIITVKATSYVDIFQLGTKVQRDIFKERLELTDNLNEAISEFMTRPNLVLLWTATSLSSIFGNLCELKVIPNLSFDTWNVFYLQQGNPYKGLFSKHATDMDESGQLGKYFRNWFSSVNPSDCESHQIDSLGIDKVFTSFVFMLLGLTLASLIFLLEGSIQKKRFEKTKRTVLGGFKGDGIPLQTMNPGIRQNDKQ